MPNRPPEPLLFFCETAKSKRDDILIHKVTNRLKEFRKEMQICCRLHDERGPMRKYTVEHGPAFPLKKLYRTATAVKDSQRTEPQVCR